MTVFAQAKAAAKKTSCLSNVKQIGTAVVMYATDYDDEWPMATYFRFSELALAKILIFGNNAPEPEMESMSRSDFCQPQCNISS